MQAIEHTIRATQAQSPKELEEEVEGAKQALTELYAAKLDELAAEVQEAQAKVGYSPVFERRAVKDNPQA